MYLLLNLFLISINPVRYGDVLSDSIRQLILAMCWEFNFCSCLIEINSDRIVCQITSDAFIKKKKKKNYFLADQLAAVHNRALD